MKKDTFKLVVKIGFTVIVLAVSGCLDFDVVFFVHEISNPSS